MNGKETGSAGTNSRDERLPEPWLRGTLTEVEPLVRAVLHSLELAREDVARWCGGLDEKELHKRPLGLPSVAFQLRHIGRSLDRFMTYADGHTLSVDQLATLVNEQAADASKQEVFDELELSLKMTEHWLRATMGRPFDDPVRIGRKALSTTRRGLLVHMAEHTQRHVGQAVTTAKAVVAQRTATA